MTKFRQLKQTQSHAWNMYDVWRKQAIFCPAFETPIRFSLLGWRHIIGATGHKKRVSSDIYRRLKLLPYAKKIIEKSTTIQNVVSKNGQLFFVLEAYTEIIESHKKQWRKIRVVIVEDKLKNKVFLSVMDKKTKKR